MDRVLNISDRTNAALHALALAAAREGQLSAAEAAEILGVSPSYLAKILQSLSRAGLTRSSRGAAGGFELARPAAQISALEVLELLDGPLPERECLFERAVCPRRGCALRRLCSEVQDEVRGRLRKTSVAGLAASFT